MVTSVNWLMNILKSRNEIKNPLYAFPGGAGEGLGVLVDQEESDPISPDNKFHFSNYSSAISDTIRASSQKFTVGIFSEWGTGKTTLMRLIVKDLMRKVCDTDSLELTDEDYKKIIANFYSPVNAIQMNDLAVQRRFRVVELIDNTSSERFLIRKKDQYVTVEKRLGNKTLGLNELFISKVDDHHYEVYENDILPIWFNAWRYEREEKFATIALMKTIAFAMGEHRIYKSIKPIILRGLTIIGTDILRNVAQRYGMTERGIRELESNLIPKIEHLAEIDRDTIYFDGLRKIEEEIRRIRTIYPKSKVVVFIDDLDRCMPETALEVFESIKVFLDIDGFVFILGLSRSIMDKLIDKRFKELGITPEEYIRKIIQVDIKIPLWQNSAIMTLLENIMTSLNRKYFNHFNENQDLLQFLIEQNPRQLKRFVNGLLLLISANKYQPQQTKQHLVLQVLQKKWDELYQTLVDPNRRYRFIKYLESSPEAKKSFIDNLYDKQKKDEKSLDKFEKTLIDMELDHILTSFIDKYKEFIIKTDFEEFERTKDVVESPVFSSSNEKALKFYEQLYALLIDTNNNFFEQVQVIKELANILSRRFTVNEGQSFEELFEIHYSEMNKEEMDLFDKIRTKTKLMKSYNSRILRLLEENENYLRDVVELEVLKEHLKEWIKKYNTKFSNPNVSVVYVETFPTGIEKIIAKKISKLKLPESTTVSGQYYSEFAERKSAMEIGDPLTGTGIYSRKSTF
jgi:hypothetical protein